VTPAVGWGNVERVSNAVASYYMRRRGLTARPRVGLGDASGDNWGASRVAAAGVAYKHEEYPGGAPGVKRSLTEMARLMREARLDAAVSGYAADVLRAAGIDGRNRSQWTARNVAQAFLDNVRVVVMYAPDALGAEVITSPAGQLCLRPNLCIRKEDCDGLSTLLGALLMCVGFRVWIVKQSWGSGTQEHVLIAVEDENGGKLLADPSHASMPVGKSVPANKQEFYDPMDEDCAIKVGAGNAELVTFGALPPAAAIVRAAARQAPARRQINDQLTPMAAPCAQRSVGVSAAPATPIPAPIVVPATPSHWGIITAGDVEAEQARTLESAQQTDIAVQTCTTLDPTVKSQWATFLAALTVWCKTPIVNVWTPWMASNAIVVDADTGDTMMSWEAQLQTWQQTLAKTCNNIQPEPAFNPSAPPGGPGGPASWADNVKSAATVVGGVVVIVTAAYVTYKVVQVGSAVAKVA
jgi:hypothetical protein